VRALAVAQPALGDPAELDVERRQEDEQQSEQDRLVRRTGAPAPARANGTTRATATAATMSTWTRSGVAENADRSAVSAPAVPESPLALTPGCTHGRRYTAGIASCP
jgi:hypothetical protein